MLQKLEDIKQRAMRALESVQSEEELQKLTQQYLGKNGELTLVLKGLGQLQPEERKNVGQMANIIKTSLSGQIEEKKSSLSDSGWRITTIREAGTATEGKRQADAFLRTKSKPMVEYDVWATRQ